MIGVHGLMDVRSGIARCGAVDLFYEDLGAHPADARPGQDPRRTREQVGFDFA